MAKVSNGESETLVNTHKSTQIPAGHKPRPENVGVVQ
jgi:hypothetical protein